MTAAARDGTSTPAGLRPVAVRAWHALVDALLELHSEGARTPCHDEPAFLSNDGLDRLMAAKACRHCPVRIPCDAFAEANQEPAGVWGGRDRSGAVAAAL
jgi:hypothetical protein